MSYASSSTEELVKACVESDNCEAWEEFIRRFRNLLGCIILRVARSYGEKSDTIIDDLIQETYLKVCAGNCRLLRNFEPQHPDAFFGMLKVTAVCVAHDYFRAQRAAKRGSGVSECQLTEIHTLATPRSNGAIDIERDILLGEIDVLLTASSSATAARDRDIFWLYHRQGFTAKAIAAISAYNLTTKGVESIIHRLTSHVRTHLAENRSRTEIPKIQQVDVYSPSMQNEGDGRP